MGVVDLLDLEAPGLADIELIIERDVYDKVMYWINKAPGEVSGFGLVEKQGDELRVVDAFLVEQENTSTDTELDDKATARLMYRLHQEGKLVDGQQLKWWWHSHVNMDVFWSGTDKEAIRQVSKHGWFCMTVLNKRAEALSAYASPDIYPMFVTDVHTEIEQVEDARIEQWESEYAENVTEPAANRLLTEPTSYEADGAIGVDPRLTDDDIAAMVRRRIAEDNPEEYIGSPTVREYFSKKGHWYR